MLFTSPIHYRYQRTGKKTWVLTFYPELYFGNPSIISLKNQSGYEMLILRKLGLKLLSPTYAEFKDTDTHISPPNHIIHEMAIKMGLPDWQNVPIRTYYFGKIENAARFNSMSGKKRIAIQSGSKGAVAFMKNKQWFPERFQQVVDHFYSKYEFIQLGTEDEEKLEHVTDLRGKTSLGEVMQVLKGCHLMVGIVGFYMHAARALGIRSIIIYGGREHPHQTGYPENVNLFSELACSPCWKWNQCEFNRKCMDMITADICIGAMKKLLGDS